MARQADCHTLSPLKIYFSEHGIPAVKNNSKNSKNRYMELQLRVPIMPKKGRTSSSKPL